jgi:hypothetical protein
MWAVLKQWKKIPFLSNGLEVLYTLYKVNDMFNFFSDVKARLSKLEAQVEAIFTHIHTEFAAKVVADEADVKEVAVKTDDAVKADAADVKTEATEVKTAVAADAGAAVADAVTKVE